jgi:hypothetical protein
MSKLARAVCKRVSAQQPSLEIRTFLLNAKTCDNDGL